MPQRQTDRLQLYSSQRHELKIGTQGPGRKRKIAKVPTAQI